MLVLLLLLQGYEHLFCGYIIVPLDGYACHELKVAPRESANEIWLGDLNARRGHAGSELWSWLDNLFGQGPQLSRPPLCMHALSIIFLLGLRSTYGALRNTRPPTYEVHGLPCTYLLALFCFSICLLISCFPAPSAPPALLSVVGNGSLQSIPNSSTACSGERPGKTPVYLSNPSNCMLQ